MCKLLQFRAFPPSSCDCLMSLVTWPLTGVETTFLNGKVICNITIFDMGYSIFAARNDHWKMWVCLQQVTSRSNGLSLFSMFKNMPWLGGMPHCQTIQISYQIDYMICIYIYAQYLYSFHFPILWHAIFFRLCWGETDGSQSEVLWVCSTASGASGASPRDEGGLGEIPTRWGDPQ
jgi:hypothetical protein